MPYYSYGYGAGGAFYADAVYWIALIPVLLLSVYAQIKVSSSFNKYSQVRSRRGITGAQAAYDVLRAHGVLDVAIKPCRGNLTDHYDPRDNTIYLSENVYNAPTVAAVGVAAHEAGHAVQYAVGYGPIRVRAAIIPATRFGSQFAFIALMLGIVLNASARALQAIDENHLLEDDERRGARKVLTAAALTYVAALLMSLLQLLRYLLIFLSRGDNRRSRR